MTQYQIIIGRNEELEFVDVAKNIPAKIDTGAYRSSVHCQSIDVVKKNGKDVLVVTLFGHPCAPETQEVTFKKFERVSVTNSFGKKERRYAVMMRVKLGSKIFTTPFTLADRSNTLMPVLIGRTFLQGRFMVDVAKSHLGQKRLDLRTRFGNRLGVKEEDYEK
ncbi:ATP-dependent zinc protease [Candidatus Saccharibacteria bacterium]|nr:ATP-dependent zinc protease [Candidatus Saccharibacteria bacterium]